jgi:Zn-dependent M28 family amino/carboxypeptidase
MSTGMRGCRFLCVVWLLLVGFASYAGADAVLDVVNTVSQSTYRHYLDDLLYTHTGDNRGLTGAQHDPARANILDALTGFGLQTYLDPFTYNSTTYYNVVGLLPGTTAGSNEIYIVSAHYDSVNCPGADDNASGVAAVLEAARVLSPFRFEATLVFAAFDREEQGLKGSYDYAYEHRNDDIRGMLSLDMIAFNDPGARRNTALLYGRTASLGIKTNLASAINRYSGGITVSDLGQFDASDHVPFEVYGKQACLLIEGAMVRNSYSNPYYHTVNDTVDTTNYIDYVYATQLTRSAVGYFATSAGIVAIPEPSSWLLVLVGMVLLAWRP